MLILTGKIVFADRPADAIEGIKRLALGMQGLALPANIGPWSQIVSILCTSSASAMAGKRTTSQGVSRLGSAASTFDR